MSITNSKNEYELDKKTDLAKKDSFKKKNQAYFEEAGRNFFFEDLKIWSFFDKNKILKIKS